MKVVLAFVSVLTACSTSGFLELFLSLPMATASSQESAFDVEYTGGLMFYLLYRSLLGLQKTT